MLCTYSFVSFCCLSISSNSNSEISNPPVKNDSNFLVSDLNSISISFVISPDLTANTISSFNNLILLGVNALGLAGDDLIYTKG